MKKQIVTVYYLDDEKAHLLAVKKAFEAIKVFSVDFDGFETPEALFEKLDKGILPAFIILDIDLKHTIENGFTVADRIRKNRADIPLVFFSSHSDRVEHQIRADSLGAPLFPKQLSSNLQSMLICDYFCDALIDKMVKIKKIRYRHTSTSIGTMMAQLTDRIPTILESSFKTALLIDGEPGTGKSFFLDVFYKSIPKEVPKHLISSPVENLPEVQTGGWLIVDGLQNITPLQQKVIYERVRKLEIKLLVALGTPLETDPELMRILRLNRILLTPLRQRRGEIPEFLQYFLRDCSLDTSAKAALMAYDYSNDNLFELQSAINQSSWRFVPGMKNKLIVRSDLPEGIRNFTATKVDTIQNDSRLSISVDLEDVNFRDITNKVLWELIKLITEQNRNQKRKNNIKVISDQIKFSRATILERLKELGISDSELNFVINKGGR